MKNTLWRIGDSWSQTSDDYNHIELNHSYYIAEHYDMDYKNIGRGGFSNLDIFNGLLINDYKYKKNDIILINFASGDRVGIYNNGMVQRTCTGDKEVNDALMNIVINDTGKYISDTLFFLINSYITSLLNRKIKVYHFYNDIVGGTHNIHNELDFNTNGYILWCKNNGYEDMSPKGNIHYKVGSQWQIADKIIELMEKNDT